MNVTTKASRMRERERFKRPKKEKSLVPDHLRQPMCIALLAEDKLTNKEIAAQCGISRRTLGLWKQDPDFAQKVQIATTEYQKTFLTAGLAAKEKRLAVNNHIHDKLLEVIKERGEEMDGECAGGGTGLMVREYKASKKGVYKQYKVDNPTIKSILELHDAVREDLGQNKQKVELTGADGQPLQPPRIQVAFVSVQKSSTPLPVKSDWEAV